MQSNPTSYLGHTLTWEKGRQLKSFDNIQYTYNANGIRTSKTVNGIKHSYVLDGTKILREEWNGNTLIPLYDNEDSVCGISYNNEPYYFQKNLQGDIIAIVDKDAAVVAKYSYDAWGACTIVQDITENGVAVINPFRYRGYYYDVEIQMYYLQSRYYNPAVGRFTNVDELEFVNIDIDLFIYANNDPVNEVDPAGCFSFPRVVLSVPLDIAFMALSPYLAPVKAFAKKFAGFALKTRLSTPLIKLIKSVAKIASNLLNAVKNIVGKIPFWGKSWAKKINVAKISQSIAGATTSAVFNFILNAIVPNITIFLSVGGFIAGFLDLLSDKKLNNKITIPFSW